ncbi:uncharacterized protein LOC129751633 [Uranotaenia lowii]|uniref:uncharacterized protein LOC129751633 n=1 Tax=Uranotaenia lowii TaxID=190385 RepID=UPI00247B0599|nr:uncharacterized protein LOC129751633 [Uranotaenia lowii]
MTHIFLTWILLFFLRFEPLEAKLYPCSRLLNGRTCYVENVTIESWGDHASVQFQDVLQIIIESSNISLFSSELFASLGETDFLTLKDSNIHTVNFSSDTLNSLRIHKTDLKNLSIVPVPNNNLNTLMINRNPLTTLPDSIRYLYGLSILDLSQNRLETINLDWFRQMAKLIVLDLSWNRLTKLDGSSDLRLQQVKNLWINHNHLTQIPWFPIAFPKLERIRLSDNYWSCPWILSMRQIIWDHKITLYDSDGACSERMEGGLCCYDVTPEDPEASRYELIEILVQPQTGSDLMIDDQVVKDTNATEMVLPSDNGSCPELLSQISYLRQDRVRLAKEKVELEQRYEKKVASLQNILRSVREDLEESEKEVSQYRLKERLQLMAKTSKLS